MRNLERLECAQIHYNLLAKDVEVEALPLCMAEQLGVMVYSPTAGGLLTGAYEWGDPPPGTRFGRNQLFRNRYWFEANFHIVERLRPIAAQGGHTLPQYAMAWLLANPAVTSVITAVETVEQLEENPAVVDRPLTAEEYRAGREASVGAVVGPAIGPRLE